MAICSATTACASKNASVTSGLRSVEKLSPTIGTTNRPFTRILPLSQRVAHAHCLSRVSACSCRSLPGVAAGDVRPAGSVKLGIVLPHDDACLVAYQVDNALAVIDAVLMPCKIP